MSESSRDEALIVALTTEQHVLQAAASATVADAAARSSLYVLALSSALVAMAFAAQSPGIFPIFVAVVLPSLFLLGVFTVIRLIDTALENNQYLAGIARIRAYYRTLTPEAADLFSAETGRWPEAATEPSLGLGPVVAFLSTTATMIAFIDSVVAGVGMALLVDVVGGGGIGMLAILAGAATVAVLMTTFFLFERWRFNATPLVVPSAPGIDRESEDPED